MKKSVVCLIVIILFMFLVGCVDYKAYDIPEKTVADEINLIDEIAQIENDIAVSEKEISPEELAVNEEVLPEISEADKIIEENAVTSSMKEKETYVIDVKENEPVILQVDATDPDNDPITYTFSKPLDSTGKWQTNYGDAGEYLVTLAANDGKLTTEQKVKIVVERVNIPPTISALNDINVKEGETVEFTPKVTDPNHDPVNVEISAPLSDGVFNTDHTSAGEYKITVTASDGELTSEEAFKLIVQDVNVPPELAGLKDLVVNEGDVVQIRPEVSDLDGDNVQVTISNPVGDEGIWQTTYIDHGEYVITVRADDGKDVVTKTISLTVNDVNMPPEFVSIGLAKN